MPDRGGRACRVLTRAELNGRALSEDEILYNCMNVAVGGNETSSHTACAGMHALTEHPEQFHLLAQRPDLLDPAVNEMLRWASTNAVSANRDERRFPNSDRFDITRTPNRHLSYGTGIHRCIGAAIAHVELTTLFRRLCETGCVPVLAGDVSRLRSNFILGITRLPLRTTSRSHKPRPASRVRRVHGQKLLVYRPAATPPDERRRCPTGRPSGSLISQRVSGRLARVAGMVSFTGGDGALSVCLEGHQAAYRTLADDPFTGDLLKKRRPR